MSAPLSFIFSRYVSEIEKEKEAEAAKQKKERGGASSGQQQ